MVSGMRLVDCYNRAIVLRDKLLQKKLEDPKYQAFTNPKSRLLTELHTIVPGVFQHSFLLGCAAAIAAHRIGANSCLARAIAYHHDLGKLLHPEMFLGSVSGDRIAAKEIETFEELSVIIKHPFMSAELLRREGNVPREIILGVLQHHGKAATFIRLSDELMGKIRDSDKQRNLRYLGPRPNSKEAALVMIGDGIEAALAGMQTVFVVPNYHYIQRVVDRIILELNMFQQLALSKLTEDDLSIIKKTYADFFFGYYSNNFINTFCYSADK